jgi:hypothetical protein
MGSSAMTMRVDFKRGCLWGLVAFVISAPLAFFWLRATTPPGEAVPWVALGAAASLATAALNVIIALDVRRQQEVLSAGAPPVEGEWGAFSGTVECNHPLRGPITGAPLAIYDYSVVESRTSANLGPTNSTFFEGFAIAPTMLRTQFGPLPLAELPATMVNPAVVAKEEALRNFLAYREPVTFMLAPTAGGKVIEDDEASRRDIRVWPGDPDWKRTSFIETGVAPGEEVVVFGSWFGGRGIASKRSGERPVLYRRNEVEADLRKNLRASISSVLFFSLAAIATVIGYQIYAT